MTPEGTWNEEPDQGASEGNLNEADAEEAEPFGVDRNDPRSDGRRKEADLLAMICCEKVDWVLQ